MISAIQMHSISHGYWGSKQSRNLPYRRFMEWIILSSRNEGQGWVWANDVVEFIIVYVERSPFRALSSKPGGKNS